MFRRSSCATASTPEVVDVFRGPERPARRAARGVRPRRLLAGPRQGDLRVPAPRSWSRASCSRPSTTGSRPRCRCRRSSGTSAPRRRARPAGRRAGADPHAITVVGHSAGGHLIAELWPPTGPQLGLPDDTVGAGPGHQRALRPGADPPLYLNDVLGMSPQVAHDASPVHRSPTAAGPLLLTDRGRRTGRVRPPAAPLAQAGRGCASRSSTVRRHALRRLRPSRAPGTAARRGARAGPRPHAALRGGA